VASGRRRLGYPTDLRIQRFVRPWVWPALWRRWFHGRLLALRSRHPDDVPPGVGGGLGCGLLLLPDRRRCYGGGGGCGDFRPRAFPMAMLSSGVALSSSWVVVVGRLLLVRAVSWLSSPVVAASGGEAILVLADQSILRVLGSSGRAVRRLCRCAGEASIGGAEVGSWSVGGVWLSCRCDSLSKDASSSSSPVPFGERRSLGVCG